jgi:hypothetical protein
MTITRLRFTKSETRDLVDRDQLGTNGPRFGRPSDWRMSNNTFFVAIVAIAGGLAVLALILT